MAKQRDSQKNRNEELCLVQKQVGIGDSLEKEFLILQISVVDLLCLEYINICPKDAYNLIIQVHCGY